MAVRFPLDNRERFTHDIKWSRSTQRVSDDPAFVFLAIQLAIAADEHLPVGLKLGMKRDAICDPIWICDQLQLAASQILGRSLDQCRAVGAFLLDNDESPAAGFDLNVDRPFEFQVRKSANGAIG